MLESTKRGVHTSMTKEIPLTQGKVALVDDEDYPELSKYNWYADKIGNSFYAVRMAPKHPLENRSTILMHRVIAGTPSGLDTDHINGDGLDNRKENLRIVTHRKNLQNLHHGKNTSRHPGICWNKSNKKWQAAITIDGKKYCLGYFDDEEIAASVYNESCKSPTETIKQFEHARKVRHSLKTSKFLGVYWNELRLKWHATIRFRGKNCHLGYYDNEGIAAQRYKIAHDWQVINL